MSQKLPNYIALAGLLLTPFAFIAATLFGFGGFSIQALFNNKIAESVSKPPMIFLILTAIGLALSGVAYQNQAEKQKMENAKLILLTYVIASTVILAISIFGLTTQFRGAEFFGETSFEEIRKILFFNSMTLIIVLALGTLQVVLSALFFKTKILQPHRLSKMAKFLTLISTLFLLTKTIIDYPLIKEVIFVLSSVNKIPFLNNIVSLVTPFVYLSAQFPIIRILWENNIAPLNQ